MIGTQFFKIADAKKTPSSRIILLGLTLLLMGVISAADYVTGRDIHLGIFYFIPIWLVTWNFGQRAGLFVSLGCAVLWFLIDRLSVYSYSSPLIPYWNAAARLGYFVTFALLIARVHAQLQTTTSQLKTLRGLLPICSACKKIRNDQGSWEQLEVYVKEHSEADFTHGICPECAKKLYSSHLGEVGK